MGWFKKEKPIDEKKLRREELYKFNSATKRWNSYIPEYLRENPSWLDGKDWNSDDYTKAAFLAPAYKFCFEEIREVYASGDQEKIKNLEKQLFIWEAGFLQDLLENDHVRNVLKEYDWNDCLKRGTAFEKSVTAQGVDYPLFMAVLYKYHFDQLVYLETGDMRFCKKTLVPQSIKSKKKR